MMQNTFLSVLSHVSHSLKKTKIHFHHEKFDLFHYRPVHPGQADKGYCQHKHPGTGP